MLSYSEIHDPSYKSNISSFFGCLLWGGGRGGGESKGHQKSRRLQEFVVVCITGAAAAAVWGGRGDMGEKVQFE